MRRICAALCIACSIVCGYTSPARADTVFKAFSVGKTPDYLFSMTATLTLDQSETSALVSVQSGVTLNGNCLHEFCRFVKRRSIVGPGVLVPLTHPSNETVPMTPQRVALLKAGQLAIAATVGVSDWRKDASAGPSTIRRTS